MPRKKRTFNLADSLARLKESGIALSSPPPDATEIDQLDTLEERLKTILSIVNTSKTNTNKMLFFVMYDIEDNRVRRLVCKYLIKKGCTRVQKSIFLANLATEAYNGIRNDLSEVQAAYDNHDSILIVPISTDYLSNMKIIGQNVNIDVILQRKTTLFF